MTEYELPSMSDARAVIRRGSKALTRRAEALASRHLYARDESRDRALFIGGVVMGIGLVAIAAAGIVVLVSPKQSAARFDSSVRYVKTSALAQNLRKWTRDAVEGARGLRFRP